MNSRRKSRVVGIDPGKDGALCAIDLKGNVRNVMLTKKEFTIPIGKGSRREYDALAMGNCLTEWHALYGIDLIAIEKQQAMPGQGVTSMFSIGMGYGLWIGAAATLRIPFQIVHPKTWQRAVLRDVPGVGKGRAILFCKQRLPDLDLTPGRKRKPHDGIADSACIAMWGLRAVVGRSAT
jgi:hypothetical protein